MPHLISSIEPDLVHVDFRPPPPPPETATATDDRSTPDCDSHSSHHQQGNLVPFINPEDVLMGRQGISMNHPGNVYFRYVVKRHQLDYIDGRRHEKQEIIQLILDEIRDRGGRFCTPYSKSFWKVVDDAKARAKTSQALREGAPSLRRRARHPHGV
jgi:hypothetical protein